jgi:hypothetical protein
MSKKKRQNSYSGVSIAYSVVTQYYPVNGANPDFKRFVFQPMIEDGEGAKDVFTIAAYAEDKDWKVLNGQGMLATTPLNVMIPAKKKCIQLANMHLDLAALATLYPAGGTATDLRIIPSGTYYSGPNGETSYMLYYAETGPDDPDVVTKTPLNPSPPYHG